MNPAAAGPETQAHVPADGGRFLPHSTLSALADFYSACGHRARVAGGCVWFDGGAFSMMSIPTALVPEIPDREVRKILLRSGKLAAVYRVPKPEGTTVPVFWLRDKNHGPANLQRQFRQQVLSI